MLAALGPKNVELAAEIAEAWQPIWFHPERAADMWGESLAAGKAKRDPALGELDVVVGMPVAIGDDVDGLHEFVRPGLALYVGGMGARGKNFYNDLAVRYGYEAEAKTIQDLYLEGKKDEAAAALPAELIDQTTLCGPPDRIRERLNVYREAGVGTLMMSPMDFTAEGRSRVLRAVAELV